MITLHSPSCEIVTESSKVDIMSSCWDSSSKLVGMMVLTTTYMIVELVVGNLTNSMALVADSFHMLSDVIALIIAFISVR